MMVRENIHLAGCRPFLCMFIADDVIDGTIEKPTPHSAFEIR